MIQIVYVPQVEKKRQKENQKKEKTLEIISFLSVFFFFKKAIKLVPLEFSNLFKVDSTLIF